MKERERRVLTLADHKLAQRSGTGRCSPRKLADLAPLLPEIDLSFDCDFADLFEVRGERRSIHQPPVPLAQQATSAEIFVTGIKAIDVLAPLERGGKAGIKAPRQEWGGIEAFRLHFEGVEVAVDPVFGDPCLVEGIFHVLTPMSNSSVDRPSAEDKRPFSTLARAPG